MPSAAESDAVEVSALIELSIELSEVSRARVGSVVLDCEAWCSEADLDGTNLSLCLSASNKRSSLLAHISSAGG